MIKHHLIWSSWFTARAKMIGRTWSRRKLSLRTHSVKWSRDPITEDTWKVSHALGQGRTTIHLWKLVLLLGNTSLGKFCILPETYASGEQQWLRNSPILLSYGKWLTPKNAASFPMWVSWEHGCPPCSPVSSYEARHTSSNSQTWLHQWWTEQFVPTGRMGKQAH